MGTNCGERRLADLGETKSKESQKSRTERNTEREMVEFIGALCSFGEKKFKLKNFNIYNFNSNSDISIFSITE